MITSFIRLPTGGHLCYGQCQYADIFKFQQFYKAICEKGVYIYANGFVDFKNVEYNGKKYGNIDLKARYTSNGILNFSKNNLITGINIVDDLLFWTDNLNQPRRINISSFK